MPRFRSAQTSSSSRAPKVFAEGRVCDYPTCQTKVSRYNESNYCYLHAPSERRERRAI